MSKKKKVIIGIIVVIIFGLCFIPDQRYNCKSRLEIISTYGDNQAYHPKVLSFKEKWNGYKYWMSYTPYPSGDDSKENPHIAVSNDLLTWKAPSERTNPIDEPNNHESTVNYNSDSHIVYNKDNNTMYCYWRFVCDEDNLVIIYRVESVDGINWRNKTVTAYSNNRKSKDYISPAIIYDNGIYKMWYVDQGNVVTYAVSKDGITWKDQNIIKLEYENKLYTWHLDVIRNKEKYEMIVVAYTQWAARNDMNLYYTSSIDGIRWEKTSKILEPSLKTAYWDNKGIYRSSFIYENGNYYVFYSGTNKKYYHGIGLMYGKDINKLNKVNVDFKNPNEIEKFKRKLGE